MWRDCWVSSCGECGHDCWSCCGECNNNCLLLWWMWLWLPSCGEFMWPCMIVDHLSVVNVPMVITFLWWMCPWLLITLACCGECCHDCLYAMMNHKCNHDCWPPLAVECDESLDVTIVVDYLAVPWMWPCLLITLLHGVWWVWPWLLIASGFHYFSIGMWVSVSLVQFSCRFFPPFFFSFPFPFVCY